MFDPLSLAQLSDSSSTRHWVGLNINRTRLVKVGVLWNLSVLRLDYVAGQRPDVMVKLFPCLINVKLQASKRHIEDQTLGVSGHPRPDMSGDDFEAREAHFIELASIGRCTKSDRSIGASGHTLTSPWAEVTVGI